MKQEVTTKKVFIRTLGCQMNVRDSEVISGLLKNEGFELTDEPQKADILLFNTCSVRQHAEDKVWSEVGRFGKAKKQRQFSSDAPRHIGLAGAPLPAGTVPIIGIVGCMAQNYKEEIFKRAPEVDFVVGPSDIHKIPGIISRLLEQRQQGEFPSDAPRHIGLAGAPLPAGTVPIFERKVWETDGGIRPEEIYHTGYYEDKEHAYVVISEGCSNYCTYCVVPYVRGELHNRNSEDILKEIKEAVDRGITKITLLGQNVNAYKYCDVSFVRLVRSVNCVKGIKEFSFITSHPKDTTTELFKAMAECEKLKKYLHLPVQSGSDRILDLMNRGYTKKFYLDLAENYRKIIKGSVLTTDIIVGFPTETEVDFQETLDLVKNIEFNAGYIFKYSPRPNTAAFKLVDDVPKAEKEKRHKIILDLQRNISNKIKRNVQKNN